MSRSLLRYDDLEDPQPPRWQAQAGPSYSGGSDAAHKRKRRDEGRRDFKKQRPQHGVWNPEASVAALAAQNAAMAPAVVTAAPPEEAVAPLPSQVDDVEEEDQGAAEQEAAGEEEWNEEAEEAEEYWEEEELEDNNRTLTHAEIWDDRALIGAWEAAVDEYDAFRLKREEVLAAKRNAHPLPQPGNSTPGVALWYEAPPPGSKQALCAFEMGRAYAAERKAGAAVTGPPEPAMPAPLPSLLPAPLPLPQVEEQVNGAPTEAAPVKKPRALKGTLPPSSKIQGSAAWHAACATISRTPNCIAGQAVPAPAAPEEPTSTAASSAPASAIPTDPELIQNLCMSWYYAGYYQAQLSAQQQQEQ